MESVPIDRHTLSRLHCNTAHNIQDKESTFVYQRMNRQGNVDSYIHLHIYTHTHIHTYIHTFAYAHTYLHIYICIRIHTYILIYIHTYIHLHTHTYLHTFICICIHTYIHAYIHTFAYRISCIGNNADEPTTLGKMSRKDKDLMTSRVWNLKEADSQRQRVEWS